MESKQLQFKSRHVDDPNQQVDWDEVDRTLKEVDPDGTLFSDPRFDSLKHALRILGSAAAEKELNQVRMHHPFPSDPKRFLHQLQLLRMN